MHPTTEPVSLSVQPTNLKSTPSSLLIQPTRLWNTQKSSRAASEIQEHTSQLFQGSEHNYIDPSLLYNPVPEDTGSMADVLSPQSQDNEQSRDNERSQSDTPALSFTTERTIDSDDAGSNQEPSESEQASSDIVTFGIAPGSKITLPASRKSINRRTADDYLGTSSSRVFSRPVLQFPASIDQTRTVESFYKHVDDNMHTTHFYQAGSHNCPFGCHMGFLNDFASHEHIQKRSCKEEESLSQKT